MSKRKPDDLIDPRRHKRRCTEEDKENIKEDKSPIDDHSIDASYQSMFESELKDAEGKREKEVVVYLKYGKQPPFPIKQYIPHIFKAGVFNEVVMNMAIKEKLNLFEIILNSNFDEDDTLVFIKQVHKMKNTMMFMSCTIEKIPINLIKEEQKDLIRFLFQYVNVRLNHSDWSYMVKNKMKNMLLFFRYELYQSLSGHDQVCMVYKFNNDDIDMFEFIFRNKIINVDLDFISAALLNRKIASYIFKKLSSDDVTNLFEYISASTINHFYDQKIPFPPKEVLLKISLTNTNKLELLVEYGYFSAKEVFHETCKTETNTFAVCETLRMIGFRPDEIPEFRSISRKKVIDIFNTYFD
jgi:hypothetical protein